jgi:cell division septal protein FtsQ
MIPLRSRELSLGVLLLVVATLAFLFGWTNLFTVKEVLVYGSPNSQITKQVLQIADISNGEKLARVEPRNISTKLALAGIDWIEEVEVSRNWISREVSINLLARKAVAIIGDKYVDSNGVLFSSAFKVTKKLPNISAFDDGSRVAAISLYLATPADFRALITSINASSARNFQIIIKDKLQINWGSDSNMALKVKIYKALSNLPENEKINQMDVSDPTKPTVK